MGQFTWLIFSRSPVFKSIGLYSFQTGPSTMEVRVTIVKTLHCELEPATFRLWNHEITCMLVNRNKLIALPQAKISLAMSSRNSGIALLLRFIWKPCVQKNLSKTKSKKCRKNTFQYKPIHHPRCKSMLINLRGFHGFLPNPQKLIPAKNMFVPNREN